MTSRPGRFTSGKDPRYPLNRNLGGTQSQSGCFGEEKNHLSLAVIEPRIFQPVDYSMHQLRYPGSHHYYTKYTTQIL